MLIKSVIALAKKRGVAPDKFEFQMLLGVCETLRDTLIEKGSQVRIYVSTETIGMATEMPDEGEPQIAGHVARALSGL